MIVFTFVNFLHCFKFHIISSSFCIQFLASAAHGYGSWGVGAAMAWQRQTCFSAGRACTFQHAQLGALQQKPLLGMHPDGAPTVQAPALTYWAAVEGQTGHKQQ